MLRHFLVSLGASASLVWCASAAAGEAGKIVFVTGQVQVASRAGVLDAAVQEGDELATGADGYIYVKTVDNGFLILRPNSKARIVSYHVDSAKPANTRVKFELLSGVARSISGTAVKQARQNFRFNTPVAAIGVRGTDFIVFTDQQTSRVAVVSGGIVVSGFAGGCGPEGGGPCEGNLSRELFAGQADVLLQVQRGQKAPQLLRGQGVSPDSAPPRADEPVGKPLAGAGGMPGSTANPNPDMSLDVRKETALIGVGKTAVVNTGGDNVTAPPVIITQPAPVAPVEPIVPVAPVVPSTPVVQEPPVVVTPPVVVVPPVVAPPLPSSPPELQWGRWQAVAGVAVDQAALAKMRDGTYENAYSVGSYVMARVKNTELVLPREGTASFVLASGEASLQEVGKDATMASIKDAHFDVNFATRKFVTGMTVYTDTASLNMSGNGTFSTKGVMSSDSSSGSTIKGYLGGNQAEQAGYVFKTVNSLKYTAEGATLWKR
nr:FecR family protein [uncultured Duganella sp.]